MYGNRPLIHISSAFASPGQRASTITRKACTHRTRLGTSSIPALGYLISGDINWGETRLTIEFIEIFHLIANKV